MKINKFDTEEVKIRKMLYNVQGYMDKAGSNTSINKEKLSRDLYIVGDKCKTPEKGNILNNCLTALAEKMISLKQDDLAGVIYSFLIKFNKDNLIILKQLLPKALEIAQKQKDSVHIAARTGELSQIYKDYQIHGTNYLTCLSIRKKALMDICSNYDTVGERFRTISRQINKKDTYLELLIKTKIDIANELQNKQDSRKELLSAYKNLSEFSDAYKIEREKTYCTLKKYISIALTNIMLENNSRYKNPLEQFAKVRKNTLEASKEGAPIENSIFNEYIASAYDEFKNNSQEERFINKALEFVNDLNNLGNHILADKICVILKEKNASNIKNLKTILLTQLEARERDNDNLGMLRYGTIIQKLFKQDSQAVTVNSYIKAIQVSTKALTNIINNYEELIKHKKNLREKSEYIEQLIFAKVNSAKLHKNTYPAYSKQAIQDASMLIDELPAGFIKAHPEMRSLVSFVTQYID